MGERATSPCIGVCSLNIDSGYCEGCFRTREEVANWWHYSPERQEALCEELSRRAKQFGKTSGAN